MKSSMFVLMVVGLLFMGNSAGADEPTRGERKPTSRSFHLGFTQVILGESPEAIERLYKALAEHADMITLHYDGGIPWPEALAEKPYPKKVEEEIAFRKSRLRNDPKVYLAVTPIALMRNALAPYWGNQRQEGLAGSERPGDWKNKDFDNPEVIAAYTNHCRRMIREFKPDYMAYGIEVNMLAMSNRAGFRKYLVFMKEVYEALKKENPNLPIFLTSQIDHYYKDKENQREAVRQLLPYTDYIAVSCYPYMEGHTPDNLPEDWFSQVAELDPSKPFAIAETGYAAEDVVILDWNVNVPGSEEWQAWYTRFILGESNRLNGRFVVWFFAHDFDAFFNQFEGEELGAMEFARWWRDTGLLDGNGNPRESLHIWDEWLKLPRKNLPKL